MCHYTEDDSVRATTALFDSLVSGGMSALEAVRWCRYSRENDAEIFRNAMPEHHADTWRPS